MMKEEHKIKIYTRTGDKGETSLYSGGRVWKDDPLMHAIGTVDECNTTLGVVLSHLPKEKSFLPIKEQLEKIQHALFDIGAALATPRTRATTKKISYTRFEDDATKHLEEWIDAMEESLPPLTNFILPGGHPAAAFLHQARSVCRRAERQCIPSNLHHDVSDGIMRYLNRLSDYLFVLSRYVNLLTKEKETPWLKHTSDEN